MRVNGIEYDTWNWRFRVGDTIRHNEVTYAILSRDAKEDDQGTAHFFYTLRSPDGVVRVVRNYIINLEAQHAGVSSGQSKSKRQHDDTALQQLRHGPDGGVQAPSRSRAARTVRDRASRV
jgi:hypothetical protein